ncbi:MAG: 6-phosphogluconolactonase [Spirochaetaceae bacterium]|nr:6-phosphogluconolactonase [Spirochaetaceae bacterium]RKX98235.1 MAG: 6-phosphogluconolactonase [Spirochaetota bacterium]
MKNTPRINHFASAKDASDAAARYILETIKTALKEKKRLSVVLPGGSAPKKLNASIISLSGDMDTSRIDWFFGDERAVDPKSPDSNYRMQMETLLEPLNIQPEHIHRIPGELGASRAAGEYNLLLADYFSGPPAFDLILLGLGPDGHTASLFPGSEALSTEDVPVVGTGTAPLKPHVERVTLTFPAINTAGNVIFFTGRTGKETIIEHLCSAADDSPGKKIYPFESVKPEFGPAVWFVYRNNS